MKTAEEVLLKVFQEKVPELKTMDGFVYTKSIIKAMEEYKNQFVPPSDLKELKDVADFCESRNILPSTLIEVYKEYMKKVWESVQKDGEQKPLKELKDITDEDLTECVNILLKSESDEVIHKPTMDHWKRLVFLNLTEGGYPTTIQPYWEWILKVYQYLQSRGYRLPVYFPVQRAEDGFSKYLESRIKKLETEVLDNLTKVVQNTRRGRLLEAKDTLVEYSRFTPTPSVNEKEAVEFAEWTYLMGWFFNSAEDKWFYHSDGDPDTGKTGADLHQLFLNNKQ